MFVFRSINSKHWRSTKNPVSAIKIFRETDSLNANFFEYFYSKILVNIYRLGVYLAVKTYEIILKITPSYFGLVHILGKKNYQF
jgi:hypothetical protein